MENFKFLQLHSDAGSVVNTTAGSVNANSGEKETTAAMDSALKDFYDTELLENAKPQMLYAQFGKKQA